MLGQSCYLSSVSTSCSNSVFDDCVVMATFPGHTGSCCGKGLQHRGWHGFIKVDDSDQLQELFCSCCQLECPSCQVWARNVIRGIGNTLPPMKSPPAFKGPPPKRNLLFKDASSSFLPKICLGSPIPKKTDVFSFHCFEAALQELGKNRKKQDFIFPNLICYYNLFDIQELMMHPMMQQFKDKALS